jgi:prophage regulatory protein
MKDRSVSNGFAATSARDRHVSAFVRDKDEFAGLVRLVCVIAPHGPIPVSKSTWWAGVRSGRYPKPVKLGPRITAWRIEDIRALIRVGSSR